jgi:hypothetical protein
VRSELAQPADGLMALASDFAEEVTHRIGRVIPLNEQFSAVAAETVNEAV